MADYAFRTIGDRMEIQRMWENGLSPKEMLACLEFREKNKKKTGVPKPQSSLLNKLTRI